MVLASVGERWRALASVSKQASTVLFFSSTSTLRSFRPGKGILKNIYLCVELALENYDARTKYK